MTPEDEIRRAGKAREVVENEIFREAFGEIEAVLMEGIKRSAFKDAELREKLCQQYIALHSIRDQLKTYMESGELATEELRRQSLADKIKSVFSSQE